MICSREGVTGRSPSQLLEMLERGVDNQKANYWAFGPASSIPGTGSHQSCIPVHAATGCGPLRAGEALGLEIGKHISEDCRTLYIQRKANVA